MRSTLEKTFFSVGERLYLWADVVCYAALCGEWPGIVERGKAVWAALVREEASGESLVEDAEIEAESDRFRYDRNLVSVDDTEKWLGTWGVDVETWLTWIRGDLLRRKLETEGLSTAELASAFDGDDEDLETFVWAEAVSSGVLSRLAQQLAGRAALREKLDEEAEGAAPEGEGEPIELADVDAEGLLPGFDADDTRRRLADLAVLERKFLLLKDRVVTPEAVAARVRSRQGDWMRIRCRILRLPTEDVAREALLSIQEDGEDMDEIARNVGGELQEGTFFLEELEAGLSDNLLAARAGELAGPLRTSDGFALVSLLGKTVPALDDPEIRKRAEESLFDSMVERETDNRVIWRWGR